MNARAAVKSAVLRCAVYTRKSSEEGLEQSFNSLHAQREACEAYIKSQAHEGWTLHVAAYDDGGFSGGDMQRPGLKALIADIAAGLIDVVVVYKVDRLTRSLGDFARIVETFDRHGVSFVSITQSFNTTTSIGRLTLNVLLSFAQFEREIASERIRDKIAASKAKGMWMGGALPLGYERGDHTLIVNEAEAAQVRAIYRRYLKLESVRALGEALRKEGVRSKARAGAEGRVFSPGALCHLLANRTYLGEIRHFEKTYPGQHPPIVPAKLFAAAQVKLAERRVRRRERPTLGQAALLTGRIFDDEGRPYSPTFSYGRGGRRYAYYLRSDPAGEGTRSQAPARIPAAALECAMIATLGRLSPPHAGDWDQLGPLLLRLEVRADGGRMTLDAERLFGGDHPRLAMQDLEARLQPGERAVLQDGRQPTIIIAMPARLQFWGGRSWRTGPRKPAGFDAQLAKALKAAHQTLAASRCSPLDPPATYANGQAPAAGYARQLCRLAFLAPALQEAILAGRQPPGLTLTRVLAPDVPLAWSDQLRLFGVAPSLAPGSDAA